MTQNYEHSLQLNNYTITPLITSVPLCQNNLVSIIMPAYNTVAYIDVAIQSVVDQSYTNWELIIIDDASTDGTIEIIQKWNQKDDRIKPIFRETNAGPGIARNQGIERADGRYITFLDSDDKLVPDALSSHLYFMQQQDSALSHAAYDYMDDQGVAFETPFQLSNRPVSYKMNLKRPELSCLTTIYDVHKIGKRYMSEHRHKQDYGMWLDILKEGHKSIPFHKVLGYYRQRKNSNTGKKHQLVLPHYRYLRSQQKLGRIEALYYTFHWAVNGVKKYFF